MEALHSRTVVAYADPKETFWDDLLSALKKILSKDAFAQILLDYQKARKTNTDESLVSFARSICAILSWLRPQILKEGEHSPLLEASMTLEAALPKILPAKYDPQEFKKDCQRDLSKKIALTDAITKNRAQQRKAEQAIREIGQQALETMASSITACEKVLDDCIALTQHAARQQDDLCQQQQVTAEKIARLTTDTQEVNTHLEGIFKKTMELS